MSTTEQIKKIQEYQDENVFRVGLKVNKKTMPEIFDKLGPMKNRQGYIFNLIRRDLGLPEIENTPGRKKKEEE